MCSRRKDLLQLLLLLLLMPIGRRICRRWLRGQWWLLLLLLLLLGGGSRQIGPVPLSCSAGCICVKLEVTSKVESLAPPSRKRRKAFGNGL